MANLKGNKESLDFVYDFYVKMKKNNINLAYEGEITHQITKAFTSLTESNMIKEEDLNVVQKKVFHVMVECLQNISKHAENRNSIVTSKDGRGIFMVSKDESEYNVTTGNVINNDKIPKLREMLEGINQLDDEGLKKLYKQQMREGRLSERGGAGLGFIDIARKTGEKLIYSFLTINEKKSFFVLTSTISRLK
ncbi:MAG: SiaB family protein kinase [Bacteroidales bacterium]|nr:SiaB family protein kinase [Bacteroidales bacterium]MBN2758791.1 SiaB family protein kinase [Bacteroidales bacterium]